MLYNAEKKKTNDSAPPIRGAIRAEAQDRPLPGHLAECKDMQYACKNGVELRANVVYPKDRGRRKLPVVVYVHGGALVIGDRNSDRVFCQELASRGFVVYSLEYRLIGQTDAFGMVGDICDGLKLVKDTLGEFGGDAGKTVLLGESAGAFMSIYAAAAGRSAKLRHMLGCGEYGLAISRLVMFSGMIYTTADDLIGLVYRNELYREKSGDRKFMARIAPDNPSFMSLLPPVFLVSSKADFLRDQTLDYANALERNHHEHRLLYFPEGKELTHAFPALLPSLPESEVVLDELRDWLSEPSTENHTRNREDFPISNMN